MTKLKKEEEGTNKHEMKRWRRFFNVLQNDLVNCNN
jgi:predicted transcriptional regulator